VGLCDTSRSRVINRTAESAKSNKLQGFDKNTNFSRLERWRNKPTPEQAKNLYPFGCLAFKFIYPEQRGKLDAHSVPSVFLGLDAKSRCYKLGSLFDLVVSIAVEVSFVEEVSLREAVVALPPTLEYRV